MAYFCYRTESASNIMKIITALVTLLLLNISSSLILSQEKNDSLILLREKRIDSIIKANNGWLEDKSANRMILAPTGRTIKQGQLQIASMVVIPFFAFPTAHIGITDYINVGLGMSIPVGLFYLAPKVRFVKTDYLSMSTGLLWCPAKSSSSYFSSLTIGYVAASFGTQSASLNVGIGYNFTKGLFDKKPVIQVGGDLQVGKGFKLISENWGVIGESVPVLSAGFRFFNDFINFDALAVFVPSKDFPLVFYPLVSLGFNFDTMQKKK